MKAKKGFAAGMTSDFQAKPWQGFSDPRSESFGGSLFGGEPCGEVGSWPRLGLGVGYFAGKKNLLKKTVAEFGNGFLHPWNFHKISSDSDNSLWIHGF